MNPALGLDDLNRNTWTFLYDKTTWFYQVYQQALLNFFSIFFFVFRSLESLSLYQAIFDAVAPPCAAVVAATGHRRHVVFDKINGTERQIEISWFRFCRSFGLNQSLFQRIYKKRFGIFFLLLFSLLFVCCFCLCFDAKESRGFVGFWVRKKVGSRRVFCGVFYLKGQGSSVSRVWDLCVIFQGSKRNGRE